MTTKKTQKLLSENSADNTMSSIEQDRPYDAQETTAWWPTGANSTKKNLATALARAQAECQNVTMNKTNPHFRSRYADLAAVRDAILPVFTKHGLSIVQCPQVDEITGFHLETRLIHVSGEEIVWRYPLPGDVNKPQAIGSAISYARRYTLSAIAAVASEEDDDGNAAQGANGGGQPNGGGARGQAGGNAPGAGGIVL